MKRIFVYFFILLFVASTIQSAYGVTEIINFNNPDDINKFIIHKDYNSDVYPRGSELYFTSRENDYFSYVDLPTRGATKIEFDLESYFSKTKTFITNYFSITFTDGTSTVFYYNHIIHKNFYENAPLSGAPSDFVVKLPDGTVESIGANVGERRVRYTIDYINGSLSMASSRGHSYSKYVGNKVIDYVTFHPTYQWWSKNAEAYLGNIKITTERISKIALTGSNFVNRGEVITLQADIEPDNVADKNLAWTSTDSSVAAVEGVGSSAIVRGIKKGTVTITATAQDGSGVTASKTITVTSGSVQGEASYILVDDIVEYQTGYSDAENDPKYGDEYKYIHNPYSLNGVTLDNVMGYVDFNDKWGDIAYKQFPKVGTYKIQYRVKDNPPTSANNSNFANYRYYSDIAESTIYVHRKPIAMYTISGSTVIDNSYDLDHSISHPTKGIDLWEWQYVNSIGYTWAGSYGTAPGAWGTKQEGIDTVNYLIWLYSGVQYKIVLRVRDIEGAWSDPCIKAAGEISMPVADFVIDKNPMLYKTDTQKITNMSYDTNGLTLSYQWTVTKGGQAVLNSTADDISGILNQTINNLYPNVAGTYNVSLKVTNSAGVQSDIVTKTFDVIVHNYVPTVDFNLVTNESPAWIFPKILGLHTLRYRPAASFFNEEKTKFNVTVSDSNTDNLGFLYNWKLERFAVKDINNISGTAANTYSYTTQAPFTNSFKGQGLPWGAYRITLNVTDKPPVPPYQSADAKTVTVTKEYYIVPELSLTGNFESSNIEIMVGDTIKLKAKTNKETENVNCVFAGINYVLSKVSEDSNFAYWEKNIVVPDSITESGTYYLNFAGSTTYGGNGNITREIRDSVPIDIVALKLINFRITDIVNHPDVSFPYTKEMLVNELIKYKAGYYVTFRIDSKGKPDSVFGRVDIGNNGSIDQIINLTKVASGDTEIWQGRFYTPSALAINTIISIKLDCLKGTVTYNYNTKENWDGRSLITGGSALQDGRVNLTN